MKGLILKDLLILKNQMKTLILIIIFFFVMSFANKDFSFVSFLIPFYMVMLIISTFSYDEFNHWDTYCNTLPYNKKDIVKAKYLLFILGILLALITGIIFSFITIYIDKNITLEESLFTLIGEIGGISITLSLFIPFLYKFGSQKGRTMLMTVVFGVSLLLGIGIKLLNINLNNLFNVFNNLNIVVIIGGILLIIVGIIYLSYKVSTKIYMNKEF